MKELTPIEATIITALACAFVLQLGSCITGLPLW